MTWCCLKLGSNLCSVVGVYKEIMKQESEFLIHSSIVMKTFSILILAQGHAASYSQNATWLVRLEDLGACATGLPWHRC